MVVVVLRRRNRDEQARDRPSVEHASLTSAYHQHGAWRPALWGCHARRGGTHALRCCMLRMLSSPIPIPLIPRDRE